MAVVEGREGDGGRSGNVQSDCPLMDEGKKSIRRNCKWRKGQSGQGGKAA